MSWYAQSFFLLAANLKVLINFDLGHLNNGCKKFF